MSMLRDQRIKQIIKQIFDASGDDGFKPTKISEGEDNHVLLTNLEKELATRFAEIEDKESRINSMLEILLKYITMDFTVKAEISNHRDEIDALAAGLNVLGEELEANINELKGSESRFKNLIRDLSVGVLVLNPQTQILVCNPASSALLGLSESQILGKNSTNSKWKVICEDGSEFPMAERPIPKAISTSSTIRNVTMGVFRPAPLGLIWMLVDVVPLLDPEGNLSHVICTFTDITERKNAYRELQTKEHQIRSFAKQLNQVLEDERSRIAREIHDEFGQQLTGLKMSLSSLRKQISGNEKNEQIAKSMMADIDNTIQSLRSFATELRPSILDTLGLTASIEWLAKEFEKKTGLKCRLEVTTHENHYEKILSTCFFRICQEALTNIIKHAGASEVIIQLEQSGDELSLVIKDNGKGIVSDKLENPFSMGILGMRERANLIGATFYIASHHPVGTQVHLIAKTNETNPDC